MSMLPPVRPLSPISRQVLEKLPAYRLDHEYLKQSRGQMDFYNTQLVNDRRVEDTAAGKRTKPYDSTPYKADSVKHATDVIILSRQKASGAKPESSSTKK